MSEPAPAGMAPTQRTRFRRVHPLTPLLRGGIFVLAWIGWIINQASDSELHLREILGSGVVVLVAGVAVGAVSWWFTRYRIDADEILVESGLLVRRSRRVRIERLQAVEVQQPLLARVLAMAELRLDTAGAEGSAVRLAFLPLAEALRLRAELLDRAEVGERGGEALPEPDVTLFRVGALRLAVSLCLRTGFLVSVASAALLVAFSLGTGEPLQLALLFAALSGVVSFWLRQLLVWGRFEIDETVQGLRVRSGLLSLRSQTVPLGRVQGVVVVEPLLWRLLGWARLDVTVAGVGGSDDDLQQQLESALMPVAHRGEVDRLVHRLLGVGPAAVPLVAAPPRAWWLSPVGQRLLGVGVHHDVVITRRGVLTTRTDVVPRRKIQSVRVLQGPLQRRLGLATTKINLPSGPVDALAPHRDQAEAWWLLQNLTVMP